MPDIPSNRKGPCNECGQKFYSDQLCECEYCNGLFCESCLPEHEQQHIDEEKSAELDDSDEEDDVFVQHLNQCSQTVSTWPKWKQELLGGEATTEKNTKS